MPEEGKKITKAEGLEVGAEFLLALAEAFKDDDEISVDELPNILSKVGQKLWGVYNN